MSIAVSADPAGVLPIAADAASRESSAADVAEHGPLYFRIGVVDVVLRSAVPGVLPAYRALYRHCQCEALADALDVRVCRERSRLTGGRRYVVRCGGERRFSLRRPEALLPHLEWGVNWQIIARLGGYLQVHAAVVEHHGAGFIFPGDPGAGKTTLTAALLLRGWHYLSDEFALLDPGHGLLHPYPRALCIKEGAFELLAKRGMPLSEPHRYKTGRKGLVSFLRPPDLGPDVEGRPCPPRFVVFTQYVTGAKAELQALSRAETAFRMRQLCFNFDHFGADGLRILTDSVRSARCFSLISGDLDASCDLLTGLAEGEDGHP